MSIRNFVAAALLALPLGLAASGAQAASCPMPGNAQALMDAAGPLIEDARRGAGKRAIRRNAALDAAAQDQACWIAKHGRDAANPHKGRGGSTPKVRVKRAGYRSCLTAENLGINFRSASAIVNTWMNSPKHRANITLNKVREYGLGVALLDNQPVWILVLAKPC